MKTQTITPLLMLPALTLMCGCSDPVEIDAAHSEAPPANVSARVPQPDPAKISQLNQQLAARMTFGTAEEIASLLQQGATTEAKNHHGLPVIFMAAQRGEPGVIALLVEAGANVNARIGTTYNDDGTGYGGTADGTALAYAAGAGKIEAMEALRKAGAEVNGEGLEGTTALMRAAENMQLEAVQWLLQNGGTAGREKALVLCKRFLNPTPKARQIMELLEAAK
jgi:ankyrin repeat protein